jgi:hypothetical protein
LNERRAIACEKLLIAGNALVVASSIPEDVRVVPGEVAALIAGDPDGSGNGGESVRRPLLAKHMARRISCSMLPMMEKDPAPFATPGKIHQGVGHSSMADKLKFRFGPFK